MAEVSQLVPSEIFKALSDPVRWAIIEHLSGADEVACADFDFLAVSKPTISYHMKILHQVGLIQVRKGGRNYYYSLDRSTLHAVMDVLWELAPTPRPLVDGAARYVTPVGRRKPKHPAPGGFPPLGSEGGSTPIPDEGADAILLTW